MIFWGGDVIDMAGRKAPARTEPRPTLSALRHFADALCPVLGYDSMRFH